MSEFPDLTLTKAGAAFDWLCSLCGTSSGSYWTLGGVIEQMRAHDAWHREEGDK
jgi:hypothetical protein